jgi:hypothetical protein
MGQAVPTQHPAVVLRSHYRHLRALLAVAMVAVGGLSAAVVILATDDERAGTATQASAPSVRPADVGSGVVATAPQPGVRYDGGPEEGIAFTQRAAAPVGIRYDGGPEEGTSGAVTAPPAGTRYDGGPEEGSRGPGR